MVSASNVSVCLSVLNIVNEQIVDAIKAGYNNHWICSRYHVTKDDVMKIRQSIKLDKKIHREHAGRCIACGDSKREKEIPGSERHHRQWIYEYKHLNPAKENLREKIAIAPVREYVKVYMVLAYVWDLDMDQICDMLDVLRSTCQSTLSSGKSDLARVGIIL